MFIIIYLNNILVYSKTFKQYINYIYIILEYLSKRRLLLKPEKYEFHKQKVNFLGFRIGKSGIRINLEKTRAIAK